VIEAFGNLWQYPAEARAITTNSTVRMDGTAVMGAGCAKEARDDYPGIDTRLGKLLAKHGNHVFLLDDHAQTNGWLFSYPVKDHWREKATYIQVRQSAEELVTIVTALDINRIAIPRPGCGNGGLKWQLAGPMLATILDDRFHVITFEETNAEP
jgi:hypothetical protein